jgi:hypothetical protein
MSRTDEIIKQLAEHGEEPLTGHFDRFEKKLRNRNRKIRAYSQVLKIAAVLVLVMLSASLFFWLKDQISDNGLAIAQNEELKEAGIYYSTLINNDLGEIEKMAQEGIVSENEIWKIKKELSEMDSQYLSMKQDYKSNPNDERVQSAMIEYYQAKFDIVNTIKSDWENARQLKIRYNENLKS